MGSGIGAGLTTFSSGSTISSSAVNSNFSAINNGGVGNDGGTLTTNGSGILTVVGLVTGTSLANLAAKNQSFNGDTSGTMSILETFSGSLKIVILEQNNYKHAGSAQLCTLNTAFSFMALMFNLGCGGIVQASSGSINNNNQVTWGTGTSVGSSSSIAQCQVDCACYSFGSFNQVGSNGGYASAHTGIAIYIGV